jgi:Dimethlysulfonioproprionate lyase
MAMYRAGAITEAQLEVYRELAAHDARDPVAALAERGLAAPPVPLTTPEVRIATLMQAADEYLLRLHHPGAEEVRAGLARRVVAATPPLPQPNAVVSRWLAPALAAMPRGLGGLAAAIADAAPDLTWVTYDAYPRDAIGEAFATSHAFASLIGNGAAYAVPDFDLGLFLIAPDVLYRDHRHAAPELYALLTGPHGWRFGPGRPLIVKPAEAPVWNPPFRPHLTKVGAVPFLALFVWTRDVNAVAEVLPAADWPELERRQL